MLLARSNQTHVLNALQLISMPHGKAATSGSSYLAGLDWLYALEQTAGGEQSAGRDRSGETEETATVPLWMVD